MENSPVENKARTYEIDLKFFYVVFRKSWYWLLSAAIIFGLLAGIYYSVFADKRYSSTINMYVNPNASSATLNSSAADALAATYPPVIRHSDQFSKSVALEMAKLTKEDGSSLFSQWTYETLDDGTELANGWSRVRSMLSTGIKDDKIFYITIRSTDPTEAYEMAKVAVKVAPTVLNEIVGVGHVEVIGYPVLDAVPDSPNVARNAVIVAIVATVLVYAIFFLIHLFDNIVRFEGDLERFGLPIIGTVPTFPDADDKAHKHVKGVKRT